MARIPIDNIAFKCASLHISNIVVYNIEVSLKNSKYYYKLPPKKWLSRIQRNLLVCRKAPWLFEILGAVARKLVRWSDFVKVLQVDQRKYQPLANNLTAQVDDFGYTGNQEVLTFMDYRQGVKDKLYEGTESGDLYARILGELSIFLKNNDVKKVLNFGVCYAHIDAELARKFPNIEFHGVDRSPFTKLLNENEFKDIQNLKFFAEDGYKLLENGGYDMLLHVRTAVVLSKPLVERLYKCAQVSKVKYVVGYEQFGLSYQTTKPYVFSDNDQESVWWRNFMFIHNYPGLLNKQGYKVTSHKFLETRHPTLDYRIFEWFAELK